MNAPDTVFVYCDYEGNPDKVDIYPLGKNSIKYIRIDTLLEWANGKLTIEGATEGYVGGYDSALKDVIDKLNSM